MSELLATVSGAEVKVWRPDAQVRARRASPPPGKRTFLGPSDRLPLVGTFARGIATRSLTFPPPPLSRLRMLPRLLRMPLLRILPRLLRIPLLVSLIMAPMLPLVLLLPRTVTGVVLLSVEANLLVVFIKTLNYLAGFNN